jgi:hypothetical protein
MKIEGSGSGSISQSGMDPRIRIGIHTKMSWIRNTGTYNDVRYNGINVCSCCNGAGRAWRAGEQQRPAGADGPGARGAYSERKGDSSGLSVSVPGPS